VWSLLGGDVLLCGLPVNSLYILDDEVVDARKGSKSDYLVGPAFLGGQTFPNGRYPKMTAEGGSRVHNLLSLVLYPKRAYFTSLMLSANY
jgi:hypothetical protein